MLNLFSLRQTRRDQWHVLPSTVYCYSFRRRFFFASSGRGHSSRRTWDLSSLLQSSSATVHSTGNPRWLLVCSTFWLLSKSILKLKVVYINAAYCICMEILFFSQKHGTCFLCLGLCRTEIQVLAPILKVRHITLPVESPSVWNTWQRKEMSVEMRLDQTVHQ